METVVLEYDVKNPMAQKVMDFVRSLGIFTERHLDLEEALNDINNGNVYEYASVDDFFKENNL